MPTIKSGNLNNQIKIAPEKNGWVVGHFIKEDEFFHNDNFEIKWVVHHKGDIKHGEVAKSSARTLVVLIYGKFVVRFPDLGKEIALTTQGDYLAYDAAEIYHSAEAFADTLLIVIRWPSKR